MYTKNNGKHYYKKKDGAGEKMVSHSKLKLWTFYWCHGECEWPLEHDIPFCSSNIWINDGAQWETETQNSLFVIITVYHHNVLFFSNQEILTVNEHLQGNEINYKG